MTFEGCIVAEDGGCSISESAEPWGALFGIEAVVIDGVG